MGAVVPFTASMRLHRRALASSASRVIEQARSRLTRRAASEGGGGGAAPPRAEDVSSAVADVARERNGYLAWSLYVALRQGEVAIAPRDVDSLAGTMLHVDEALHGDMAAKRTLSILDAERQGGRRPSERLLAHAAAASAKRGLPDLAEALCDELDARGSDRGSRTSVEMRASLISACGAAKQLTRAFSQYRALEHVLEEPAPRPAIALLGACVDAGELDAAFELFEELRASGRIRVQAGALVPLLRGCAVHNDVRRARTLLELASSLGVEVRSAAVREFARHGNSEMVSMAAAMHRSAVADGARMPRGSTTKLARACLLAGDADATAELLGMRAESGASSAESAAPADAMGGAELDGAFDLLHSVARQELQREQAEQDTRRQQRRDDAPGDRGREEGS